MALKERFYIKDLIFISVASKDSIHRHCYPIFLGKYSEDDEYVWNGKFFNEMTGGRHTLKDIMFVHDFRRGVDAIQDRIEDGEIEVYMYRNDKPTEDIIAALSGFIASGIRKMRTVEDYSLFFYDCIVDYKLPSGEERRFVASSSDDFQREFSKYPNDIRCNIVISSLEPKAYSNFPRYNISDIVNHEIFGQEHDYYEGRYAIKIERSEMEKEDMGMAEEYLYGMCMRNAMGADFFASVEHIEHAALFKTEDDAMEAMMKFFDSNDIAATIVQFNGKLEYKIPKEPYYFRKTL